MNGRIDALMDDKLTADLQLSDAEKVVVQDYEKKGTKGKLAYQTSEEGQYVDFPIQKYLGYTAEDENGTPLEVTYGNNYRVRVMLNGDGASHTVFVRYRQPVIFRISQVISLLTLLGCIAVPGYFVINRRKRSPAVVAAGAGKKRTERINAFRPVYDRHRGTAVYCHSGKLLPEGKSFPFLLPLSGRPG